MSRGPLSFVCVASVFLAACSGSGTDTVDTGPDVLDEDAYPTSATSASDSGLMEELVCGPEIGMPSEPTVSLSNLAPASSCQGCHPTHFAQWRESTHSYAMLDPVYRALTRVRQEDNGGADDAFCTQCHSNFGTRSGAIQPGYTFEELPLEVLDGVTCDSCHKISDVICAYNAGHVLDETGPYRGGIQDPIDNGGAHASEYSPLFEGSELCGSCHDVIETDGLDLERPYGEWLESPATDQNCQTCHMPESIGPAAVGGPDRTLHNHQFIGVGIPVDVISDQEREAAKVRVQGLLDEAASLEVEAESVQAGGVVNAVITVKNEIGAHNFPTGSSFNRQFWLELIAEDAEGNRLYETGLLDANGDLKDFWSELEQFDDDDLISFHTRLVDPDGNPTIFSHIADEHLFETLSPLYDRTFTLFIPTKADTVGPIHISARLRFRQYGPYLLRQLGLGEYANDDRLPIFDIDSTEVQVPLAAP